jgi:hypothetical protein
LLGIKEGAKEVLHFLCGWTNRGEDHVFDRKMQRLENKEKAKTKGRERVTVDVKGKEGRLR